MSVYRAEAAAAGMSLTDYLALTLARAHNLESPAYIERNTNPDQRPLLAG